MTTDFDTVAPAGEVEFRQAIHEMAETISTEYNTRDDWQKSNLWQRLCTPERVIEFRVVWTDRNGSPQVNRGYRVQMNGALGPYKGGLRFHPTVNRSILKFLAFEQVFKNALTGLPLGGGKGGADFDPKGKTDLEIMNFCRAFMDGLWRELGPARDVPAGDIGVGGREIGYLFGRYRELAQSHDGTITGKARVYGGSDLRPQATGYGVVFFLKAMLAHAGTACSEDGIVPASSPGTSGPWEIHNRRVLISGSGQVALYAAEQCLKQGMQVVSLSDSGGTLSLPDGLSDELLQNLIPFKLKEHGRLQAFAAANNLQFLPGKKPWGLMADTALPCATQNEVLLCDADQLIGGGVKVVVEGANMPCESAAIARLRSAGVLFAPGKAANAGGVATSGFEMAQNAQHLFWSPAEVERRLHETMENIHKTCVDFSLHQTRDEKNVNYVEGANRAAFHKVAEAVLAQGY